MPELYGQPYKWELREEIRRLRREHKNEWKARVDAENRLEWARCEIAELKATIERMQQHAQAIVSEGTQDTTEAIFARQQAVRSAEIDAALAAAAAEASH